MEQTNERIEAGKQDRIEVKKKWECTRIRKSIQKTADEQLDIIQWWHKRCNKILRKKNR